MVYRPPPRIKIPPERVQGRSSRRSARGTRVRPRSTTTWPASLIVIGVSAFESPSRSRGPSPRTGPSRSGGSRPLRRERGKEDENESRDRWPRTNYGIPSCRVLPVAEVRTNGGTHVVRSQRSCPGAFLRKPQTVSNFRHAIEDRVLLFVYGLTRAVSSGLGTGRAEGLSLSTQHTGSRLQELQQLAVEDLRPLVVQHVSCALLEIQLRPGNRVGDVPGRLREIRAIDRPADD